METGLKDKVVVITGAASGQGKSTSYLFADEGAKVVVTDRHAEAAETVAADLRAKGHEAIAVALDVSDPEAVTAAFDTVYEKYGRVDVLVNNAGVGFSENSRLTMANVVDTPVEHWNAIVGINLTGVAQCTKAVLPRMAEQGSGVIVNISSINGMVALAGADAYTASKGGVIALTRAVAAEWGKKGIRVNCVCPGGVNTPMIQALIDDPESKAGLTETSPLGRLAEPEEIGNVSLFLASDRASFVNGVIIPVDGGYTAV